MDLESNELEWLGNTPRSSRFNDIYYSPENGLLESEYVFLKHNQLEQRWQQNANSKYEFVIAETGFGTGLNFLLTCLLWMKHGKTNQKLHYFSFELFPLAKSEIEKAHSNFPQLAEISRRLLECYPKRIEGFHHMLFDESISLTLYFGDATKGLDYLDENNLTIDAWYFDGFSPNENEMLWSEALFNSSKRFNDLNTSFSTFTAAGHVKRKLQNIGFHCKKVKGFGSKREMLTGIFSQRKAQQKTSFSYQEKPWLIKQNISTDIPKKVAIIGAGLAGAWTARKLAERNIKADIFDRASNIATEASGNSRGATYFRLDAKLIDSEISLQFYLNAYLYSIREFNQRFKNSNNIWHPSGLIQLAVNEKQKSNLDFIRARNPYKEITQLLSMEQASVIAGTKLDFDALYFPDAGSISPQLMCEALCKHERIHFFSNQDISQLKFNNESKCWNLATLNKNFTDYDAVVLTNSHAAQLFKQTEHLPLHKVRGQSTQLKANRSSQKLKTVICTEGYITPEIDGRHTIGSTFDPRNQSIDILEQDNQSNLQYLEKFLPDFYQAFNRVDVCGAKAALRCQTPDMLPILGQLCDYNDFIERYYDIGKGQLKKVYPAAKYYPGLYINSGHASRGLISTPFCAEILVREICHEAAVCETPIKHALSPTRFYLRDLKQNANNKSKQGDKFLHNPSP